MDKITLSFAIIACLLSANAQAASSDNKPPKQVIWNFDGPLGTVDRQSAQRGFQVYQEVCSSCHGLKYVAYRNLAAIGFSEDEIKFIAAEKTVRDGPNDDGEMFDRPAKPFDKFVGPFMNSKAARAANGGAFPPDLSLIIKARADGANYVYSLLTGFRDAPKDFHIGDGMSYNPYFPGSQIAMAAPLSDEIVEYQDGTKATIDQMSRDVVNFLQWAAEPEMEERKAMGIKVVTFLIFFIILFAVAKKRVWSRVK